MIQCVEMSQVGEIRVYESTGPPSEDLAREAWLLERAAEGEVSLLFTSWPGRVVVLGYAQKAEEADLEWCRANGLPVLRRLTGGTGVIHHGDLGVGLALPQSHPWAKEIRGLYDRFLEALAPALGAVGGGVSRLAEPRHASRVRSPICFLDQLSDSLVVDGRKAVGCAQTRRRGAVLIHAAVLLNLDAELYARVFGVSEEMVRAGLAPAVTGIAWQDAAESVTRELASSLGLEARRSSLMPVPSRFLEPYSLPHWAPVAEIAG
jgi:lipoate-protein ligase A